MIYYFGLSKHYSFFYVLLLVNEAELRIYVFLALLCGFAAYQSMLKAIYMRLLNFLIYIFCANNTLFCSNYTATHDKTCYYYSAAIYCIYIILISYTAFNWTCVMENGDLDITFHMESFFLACSIYCFAHMETSP